MSILKRTFTTVFSKVDQIVGEIENHDALIQVAITERRNNVAVARVELAKIKKQEHKVSEQISQLEFNESRWSERAIKESYIDEEKALLCMQQRLNTNQRVQKFKNMQQEYIKASQKMKQDIAKAEYELSAMTQKQQLMRARQSTSDALNKMSYIGIAGEDELDICFDRWNVKLAKSEYNLETNDIDLEVDDLEQVYLKEENQQALREQLSQLLKEGQKNEH